MDSMSIPNGNYTLLFSPPLPSIFLASILMVSFENFVTNEYFGPNRIQFWGEMGDEEWAMVGREGTQLVIKDRPFFINGFNTYWLMVFAVGPETRSKVSDVFKEAKGVGLNVCRTWAFNDGGWRALQTSPYNYDEEVFKALDFVVSEARSHQIRLILSLCNNWGDYGGKPQYVKWGKDAGLNLTDDDDFFSDPIIKDYYKAFVKAVLTRVNTITNVAYKDDPTILAWELINEPECPSDPSGDKLQAWIEEMASYVKSIDPVHLLECGVEGFYGPSNPERLNSNPASYSGQVGTDFIRNHQASGIDIASVHIYSDSWLPHSISDDHLQFVKTWMEQHMDDAAKLLRMPIMFAEFGASLKDERFDLEFREAFFETVYSTFLSSRMAGGVGGGCVIWQLFPEGVDHMDDGYAIILAKAPSTQNVISLNSKNLLT
ncbi:mannan endo-1,4-beta-mannosidase 8-like [Typha latifolia]|uniref:mannan endo-1,4-beta-mannosidase 8-like n=1 Tax=Typha latifolia TaxID=4733 RepID=UPI003C2DFD5C